MTLPRFIVILAAIVAFAAGCESRDTVVAQGEYVQQPFGYVPPFEADQRIPLQVGPPPVPTSLGQPATILVHTATPPIEVIIDEHGLRPAHFHAQPGQLFTIKLINKSDTNRGLRLDFPDAVVQLPEDIAPGETRELRFLAPLQPGNYRLISPAGHQDDRALEANLIVQEVR